MRSPPRRVPDSTGRSPGGVLKEFPGAKQTVNKIRFKFLPDYSLEQIQNLLLERQKLGYIPFEDTLTGIINKRIGQVIVKTANDKSPQGIANAIKNFDLTVTGNLGFNYAQVTKGGVKTCEVDKDTMQSKLNKGLYIVGEALDVDGDCGGYNLTFAFVSGILSAQDIKQKA